MTGHALSDLVQRMRRFEIHGSPTDLASLLMEVFREKTPTQLDAWLSQLAVDVLQVTPTWKRRAALPE